MQFFTLKLYYHSHGWIHGIYVYKLLMVVLLILGLLALIAWCIKRGFIPLV